MNRSFKAFHEERLMIADLNRVLRESPQKMPGNAPFEELSFKMLSSRSMRFRDDFNLVESSFININNESFDLYVSKDHPYYLLGRPYKETEKETRFATIFDLSFSIKHNFKSSQKQFKHRKVITIDTVHTANDYRKEGIAQKVYESILKEYIVISDQLQYEGAVNLWKRLIANNVVYIYDILDDKIISKVSENTPESQIWSDTSAKRRIRLVMISS